MIVVWNIIDQSKLFELESNMNKLRSLVFGFNDENLYYSDYSSIGEYNIKKQECTKKLEFRGQSVNIQIALCSHTNSLFSLSGQDQTMKEWSITPGLSEEPLYEIGKVVENRFHQLVIDPSSATAFVADNDGVLRQFDLSSKVVIKDYEKVTGDRMIRTMGMSPDGKYLILSLHSGHIAIWKRNGN